MNSPLLLELPPSGQVQVVKACRLMAPVSRALIHSRDGESLSCLAFLLCIISFGDNVAKIYLLDNFTLLKAFDAKDFVVDV